MGTTNSKPLGPITMIDQSEILSRVPFTSHGKLHEFGPEKPIS
jgi:hypothetical protein